MFIQDEQQEAVRIIVDGLRYNGDFPVCIPYCPEYFAFTSEELVKKRQKDELGSEETE